MRSKRALRLFAPLLLGPLFFARPAAAQHLHARVSMESPERQFLHVDLELTGFDEPTLDVVLPVWTPGSYKVRDYSQLIEGLVIVDGDGRALSYDKVEKNRWRIQRGTAERVHLRYDSFANERSVRFSYLDDQQAFLTFATFLPYVEGHTDRPYEVTIEPAFPDWRVDTTLPRTERGSWLARDYDQLVDTPMQVGTQTRHDFEVDGVPFGLVVTGDGNLKAAAMCPDIAKIVHEAAAIFGGLPFERYLFLLRLDPRGGGGLEHSDCCSLMSSGWRFDSESGWEGLLGLVAHEFFHVWNVKRIRDVPLGPFDYTREVYTDLLWVHEGWTTYYADVLMRRAGFKNAADGLRGVESSISSYLSRPGRSVQSLADSSFDAWIKRYQTTATTRNSTVDYYGQGATAALCLDLIVRHHSEAEHSLDDVLRVLWDEYAAQGAPIDSSIVLAALERFGGDAIRPFWDRHIYGTDEIDFAPLLAYAGLELVLDEAEPAKDEGAGTDADEEKKTAKPWDHGDVPHLGWRTSSEGRSLVVRSIDRDGPAWRAGFAVGDELLAIGDRRVSSSGWEERLKLLREQGEVELLIAREGRLLRKRLPLDEKSPSVKVRKAKETDELARKIHEGLFGEPFEKQKAEPDAKAKPDAKAEAAPATPETPTVPTGQ